MTKLEAAIAAAELYRDLNAFDCSVLVTNAEGVIIHYTEAKTFQAKVKIGEPAPGASVKECIATKQIVKTIIPEHIYGVKLRSIVRPIFEKDGTFSGVVGMAISLLTEQVLHNAAHTIASMTEEITATTEELAASASRLSHDLAKVKSGSERVITEINKTDEILRFVSDVAANSNLLGLNAAIEAARAGEQGRGFAVVADEIRKMAINSSQSVNDIKKILQNIEREAVSVVEVIGSTAQLSEHQAIATEQIGKTMQELTATANEVENIANMV
ncbi:methyl-accepting chemotaxis protein [Sporomusa malonica]|uniref:Methyl-accepting chemotaxis protein (MCP) signalling domain-containing protein n=2 Tax=Sporomusa malonica TaxID=112901 RepID=A0A1W2BEN1_9FIRM|nr:methyl-accepting chemotaxis protein [Sporomusa malonica]SMC71369.1 Methyl-accepting chemotaxis protein (MCP) signalling domain-containing protein [Sporomusa malonica]